MTEELLIEENFNLSKEIHLLNDKYKICLQAFNALIHYDHTGIIQKALAEIEKLDE